VKTFDAIRALHETSFGRSPISALMYNAGIFGVTEFASQLLGPALSAKQHRGHSQNHNHDERDDQRQFCCS
jgi:hypothetical protein